MRWKWFPWQFIVRRVARAQGFLDPITVLSHLHRFAQPAEVTVPTELLRAGAVLHARGLMNSQAIQHNMDWIWPYWVARQFDPHDVAFVPRAFSLTHINLTHRNWTAVGVPDCDAYPIVDPRGLVTPLLDGWSLDAWIVLDNGPSLVPSQLLEADQSLITDDTLAVITRVHRGGLHLMSRAEVVRDEGRAVCRVTWTASWMPSHTNGASTSEPLHTSKRAWLAVSLRPYNPEGVSFIHDIDTQDNGARWLINRKQAVQLSAPAERMLVSDYRCGDVARQLPDDEPSSRVRCDVGMATAAALYELPIDGKAREVVAHILLEESDRTPRAVALQRSSAMSWPQSLDGHCRAQLPDAWMQFLYDAALRSLILHAPGDIYPGPYTYRRFWFRDAAFIIHALLCANLSGRAERAIDRFPNRQTAFGYFLSQEGEWDSNGEALWTIERFCALTGRPPKPAWRQAITKGAKWIQRKRLSERIDKPHAGLLPAGFSAEHLGPNDYYYWDDFWAIAGLRSAANLLDWLDGRQAGSMFRIEAERLLRCVDHSLKSAAVRLGHQAMPASPYRRMDAGAIGSLAAGYPLKVFDARDPRLLQTVEYLLSECFIDGGFFQQINHSGLNPYLSLDVAQVLLRAGDPRAFAVMQAVARIASPTGQWPEAVHPRTRGGCMGDGQHIWAAAEWVLMVRNGFVREEDGRLILGSGIPTEWLAHPMSFGPAPTEFGPISIAIQPRPNGVRVSWEASWHRDEPRIEWRLPGCEPAWPRSGQTHVDLARMESVPRMDAQKTPL